MCIRDSLITHVILDAPGALGGAADAVADACAEVTESLCMKERHLTWPRLGLQRFPSATWPFDADAMWVQLLMRRKRVLVHVFTRDLWANPLGTWASVRSARARVNASTARRLHFYVDAGGVWDTHQHESMTMRPEDLEVCGKMKAFVTADWDDDTAELRSMNNEAALSEGEGAGLVEEWMAGAGR
eukprot:TRINITY_DN34216_c0_g1_i1.p1 TRINITY_DN34216_c0_g1~~TRINITY_DN34216_c0_g1_i1.p1  ORF type:complete len:186 (-),score=36.20 TRINITY_DN34216_c0_g1_i1:297-854(-)